MSVRIFFRDSFCGRLLYHASGGKICNYKEEQNDYIVPEKYLLQENLENLSFNNDKRNGEHHEPEYMIVAWDDYDQGDNPHNWPFGWKLFFMVEVGFLTLTVYMSSSLYTPGETQIMEDFNVSRIKATLPLTMFVIGYAIGPMLFSPLSETAELGRTSIYILTLFLFFILKIPTALSKNIASLSVLRLIAGFFASPGLATGGASVGDVVHPAYLPMAIAAWSVGGVSGPSTGPLLGAVMTVRGGWRWCFWFICILSGTCLLLLSFFLPESSEQTLLLRKAQRLRKITGNPNIKASSEMKGRGIPVKDYLISTLWRPVEISIFEPIVFLINLYIALVYSVLYLWFKAFPIVYMETYHFALIPFGTTFLSIVVGVFISSACYILYIKEHYTNRILAGATNIYPEFFLPIMTVAAIFLPVGILVFGWASSPDTHWFGSLVGSTCFGIGFFIIFQTGFNYLGASFLDYIASVFAGNNLFRSLVAGCFPLFGRALFTNLSTKEFPVAWGCSVLGFISVGMIAIPVVFYLKGSSLRARSKYATVYAFETT